MTDAGQVVGRPVGMHVDFPHSTSAVASTSPARTGYITYNLAGGNDYFAQYRFQRINTVRHLMSYIDYTHPHAVSVQELCKHRPNTGPEEHDAYGELIQMGHSRGYSVFTDQFPLKIHTDNECDQRNAVLVPFVNVEHYGENYPAHGEDEVRSIVCSVSHNYITTTTCSTHLAVRDRAARDAESRIARGQVRDHYATDYALLGGDFNSDGRRAPPDRESEVLDPWYYQFSEGDIVFSPPRFTCCSKKIDYLFGQDLGTLPRVVAAPGAAFDNYGNYSDHAVYMAPFDWYV